MTPHLEVPQRDRPGASHLWCSVLLACSVALSAGCGSDELPPERPEAADSAEAVGPAALSTPRDSAADPFDEAVVTLRDPSDFADLPERVLEDLIARGCEVPQTYLPETRNVVSGAFSGLGAEDWAVLCSINDESSILVYWESSPGPCPSEIARSPNSRWLQGIGGGEVGFSRLIGRGTPEFILSRSEWWPETIPGDFEVEHDGIDDLFIEKGSQVWYCWRGNWMSLPGAD